MENIGSLIIRLAAVIASFVAALSLVYIWLLPKISPEYKTYSFLIIGIIGSALLGSYFSYQAAVVLSSTNKVLLTAFGGIVTAALVAFLTFLIILNIKGS